MRRLALGAAGLTLAASLLAPARAGAHASGGARYKVVTKWTLAAKPKLWGKAGAKDCPSAATCGLYKLGKARWPVGDGRLVMPFRYSDDGRPARAPAADAVRAAVRSGAAEWHRWNTRITFSDAGTTTARPGARGSGIRCGDGINTIGWKPLPMKALGVTYVCYDAKTMEILDADTAFNSTLPWSVFASADPAARSFDVQSVATHELGHWLSFVDLYTLRSQALTMHGSGQPGEISKRTLALGDILGAQAAYPCGAGCPALAPVDD